MSQNIWKAFFNVPDHSSILRGCESSSLSPAKTGACLFMSTRDAGLGRATAAGLLCGPGDLWPSELEGEDNDHSEISYWSNCLLYNKNDSVALGMNSPRESVAGSSWRFFFFLTK